METLHHPSTRQTVLSTHGEMAQSILEFPREMRRVEPSRIWEAINASQSELLECVLVRSDNEAVVVNLDIEPVESPEQVLWVDPIHKGT